MAILHSIIITYHPDPTGLGRLVQVLKQPNHKILLIDNFHPDTDYPALHSFADSHNCTLHRLPTNTGIAYAQNVGIRLALAQNPDFLVFFDQDSDPSPSMIADLAQAYLRVQEKFPGQKIAALGPRYTDPRQNNPPPFLQFRGLKMHRCPCHSDEDIVPVDYLISSGSLVSATALQEIGVMREDFFIDYVDIEWGLRATSKGYQNYGVCAAKMNHSLGDSPKKLGKKQIPIHSPLRHYYHFRNAILLYREPWVPGNWKFVDGYRLILKYVYYSLFTEKPWKHWKMMSLGIWHGILGRAGQFQGKM